MMNEYPTSARSRESACNKIGGDEEKPGSCNRDSDPSRKPVATTSKAYEGGSLGPTTVLSSIDIELNGLVFSNDAKDDADDMSSSSILASTEGHSQIGKMENDEKNHVIPKPDPDHDIKPFKKEDLGMGFVVATDRRMARSVVKPEPYDIGLDHTFENTEEDAPRPTKLRKVFMEAVVVPTVASVLRRPVQGLASVKTMDDKEIQKKQEKLCNPKVKKKKNLAMSMDSVHHRLRDIGYDPYPIPLAKDIQDVTFTRHFISYHYGGNTQEPFPSIGQFFLDKHGLDDFMYPNLEYNPHAPEVPGAPGLFFEAIGGPAYNWPQEQRVISRIKQGEWQYQGQYVLAPAKSLTKEEWGSQRPNVQNTWAKQICTRGWGRRTRARITLRQQLRRDPTPEEVDNAMEAKNEYSDVTPEQVGRAFTRGEECIAVWTMRCIGYDVNFQQNLAEKFPGWVPPPAKAKKAKNGRPLVTNRKPTKQGPSSKPRGQKRKREESVSVSDHEEADYDETSSVVETDYDEASSVVEEPVYRPRGTRSRPIFL